MKRQSRKINKVEKRDDALFLTSDYGILRIKPISDTIIRISFTGREKFVPSLGAGISYEASCLEWNFVEKEDEIVLQTKELSLGVLKETGSVRYYKSDGTLLLAERSFESHILKEYDSFKTIEDEHAVTESIVTADGIKQKIKSATKEFDKKLYCTRLYLDWQEDEALFGLGQSPEGTYNLRGSTQYLHQANMKIAVPFLISTKGYGILLATGGPALFQDTSYGSYLQTEADEQMDFYFISGNSHKEIVQDYRMLTGKAVMLPKWTFGYMQSQERYETAKELVDTVREYRRRGIGLDCIILDWLSWEEGQWGQKSFDPERFPNPAKMMEELHEEGARLMISIWPHMHESGANHAEFKEKGLLLPFSEIYDAFNKDGRELYWKQANEGLFSYGVDAWWCDSSEPFTPEWSMEMEPDSGFLYQEYIKEADSFVPLELGNAFGLYHAKGIYEGQRRICKKKRVTNLTRSGYTGQQKYGTILWSGDTAASWKTMENQIAAGLHLCACGLPYWTLDIGAFFVKRGEPWFWSGDYPLGNEDLGFRELYTRWFQFGAFLPIFRAHGTDVRRELWQYGELGEPFYDAMCKAVSLRYQLMPYIYSLAGAVWHNDDSMIRFLALEFPNDRKASQISNQYMFGPAFMVCPITKPMLYDVGSEPIIEGDSTQLVYLPSGTNWYDFWTNEKYQGGNWIRVNIDIQQIPLFVREGSIIPMTEEMNYVDENPEAEITVYVYEGSDGEFIYYDDDGDGYAYEEGEYHLIRLTWNERQKSLTSKRLNDHSNLKKPKPEFVKKVITGTWTDM